MKHSRQDRRAVLLTMVFALVAVHGSAAESNADSFSYRGFTVDISAIRHARDADAVLDSLRHQIDIVADCGANPDIISFFRGLRITVEYISDEEPGQFVPGRGVEIDARPQPHEKPILLHELLHAYHALVLPRGVNNPDIVQFYNIAKRAHLYPASNRNDRYVLKNAKEFFAVTASLYLWGNVDRQPHTRENLRGSQPHYYDWLGKTFGVNK